MGAAESKTKKADMSVDEQVAFVKKLQYKSATAVKNGLPADQCLQEYAKVYGIKATLKGADIKDELIATMEANAKWDKDHKPKPKGWLESAKDGILGTVGGGAAGGGVLAVEVGALAGIGGLVFMGAGLAVLGVALLSQLGCDPPKDGKPRPLMPREVTRMNTTQLNLLIKSLNDAGAQLDPKKGGSNKNHAWNVDEKKQHCLVALGLADKGSVPKATKTEPATPPRKTAAKKAASPAATPVKSPAAVAAINIKDGKGSGKGGNWVKADFVKECKSRGLSTSGNLPDLKERLGL